MTSRIDALLPRGSEPTWRRTNPLLFVGETPSRSAPSWTLAHALEERGIPCEFSEGLEARDTPAWLTLARLASAIVYVNYAKTDRFTLRQLALAVAAGTPVIRWWVGTDVHRLLENPRTWRVARAMQQLLSRQVAVSPHLVGELESAGLHAEFVPSVLDPGPEPRALDRVPKALLVYLPGHRRGFFREASVRTAVKANSDVEFVIVGDDTGSLAGHPNVRNLGWVSDMEPVWDRVGGLLRLTVHDGMPRMVLDALRRGKHVLYSWPFPGCELTASDEEVLAGVARFRKTEVINSRGIEEARRMMTPPPGERFARIVRETVSGHPTFLSRLRAAKVTAVETLRMKSPRKERNV